MLDNSKTRFNKAPTITKSRTKFDLSHTIRTTCNTGELIPVFAEPVYPGETHELKASSLVRLETSLHQTMDNAYMEIAYFFVPIRLIFNDFEKMMGANDDPWTQSEEFTLPQIILGSDSYYGGGYKPGSLLNHLMVPSPGSYISDYESENDDDLQTFDACPLLSVFQIYNDYFRDENYESIIYFDKDGSDFYLTDTLIVDGERFDPFKDNLHVNRFKDVFSTVLPAPQKGDPVTIGMSGFAPLIVGDNMTDLGGNLKLGDTGNQTGPNNYYRPLYVQQGTVDYDPPGNYYEKDTAFFGTSTSGDGSSASNHSITKSNLGADLSKATAITINQLRLAIASQAIAERDARGGTRMKEIIMSTWGVDAPDLQLDRAEFLGGKRIPISMMEVLQTSETGTTVLGTDAGHSKTFDQSDGFIKSFTQYGWIIGLVFFRTARSYSQGVDRKFRNKTRYDLYDPMLDNIGEVAVLNGELAFGHNENDNGVFGYQEAWYHLKERLNRDSGYFQTDVADSLNSWTYGDLYDELPVCSPEWLKEGEENVDRTIAVSSEAAYQWTLNIYFDYKAVRTMHKYSIPNTFGFGW